MPGVTKARRRPPKRMSHFQSLVKRDHIKVYSNPVEESRR
jgi:hypothetical protein